MLTFAHDQYSKHVLNECHREVNIFSLGLTTSRKKKKKGLNESREIRVIITSSAVEIFINKIMTTVLCVKQNNI